MQNHQPKAQDAVFGGQAETPLGSLVLGGIEGVKRRLASPAIALKVTALREALNYGGDAHRGLTQVVGGGGQ